MTAPGTPAHLTLLTASISLFLTTLLSAQWNEKFYQDPYWYDGKAEYYQFEAQEKRYNQLRKSKVIHIVVSEPFHPKKLVKADDPSTPGSYPVLKLNQIYQIPTGVYDYNQMLSHFWDQRSGELIKYSLTSNDGCGNTFKIGTKHPKKPQWTHRSFTYWEGMEENEYQYKRPSAAYLTADELPLTLRSLDFETALKAPISIQLGSSILHSKEQGMTFSPTELHVSKADDYYVIQVKTKRSAQTSHQLHFEKTFPHRLLEWQKADGSVLKRSHFHKIAYWQFNGPEFEDLSKLPKE